MWKIHTYFSVKIFICLTSYSFFEIKIFKSNEFKFIFLVALQQTFSIFFINRDKREETKKPALSKQLV